MGKNKNINKYLNKLVFNININKDKDNDKDKILLCYLS
jgi:hypothetical protein